MKVSFPFHYSHTNSFGKVFCPYVTIGVWKKSLGIYVNQTAIVDTGSDMTMFPRYSASLFGINLASETQQGETFGIGGSETIFLYKDLKIKLGGVILQIPVGFLNNNAIPPLLGRQKCLERFSVCFEDRITIFKKSEILPSEF